MGSHVRQNVGCQHQCPNMEEDFGSLSVPAYIESSCPPSGEGGYAPFHVKRGKLGEGRQS